MEALIREQAGKYEEMQNALAAVNVILDHLSLLDRITSREELEQKMPGLLASLGEYSMSDRAYIFAWADEKRQVLRMTHEWCKEGVAPTMGEMQHVSIDSIPNWIKRLNRGEEIFSMDWKEEGPKTPEEYQVFDGQGIHALIVIPIFSNQKLNGYIGFDNPEQSKSALSLRLLKSVGGHIGSLKETFFMIKEMENALAEATLNSEIIGSISKIYWLIYRMDLVTGMYEEISAGHDVHRLTGKHGNTAEVFKEVRETVVAPEHQELMKRFLDTSTLAERLKDTESIAMEYHAVGDSWHLGRFIVKKRDEAGRVTNVLYVVRQIDKQKQMELEYKQKLIETAEEARRANIAKTDFLRRMSHDIRTPINGIQGMVAIAEHFPKDMEKQKECRDKVKEASGFLLDLVNSILDMNKLESGTIVLEHKPFDLLEVVQEANSIVEMNGELKGLRITTDHEKVLHTHLLGSKLHFKQVLQNIAGNAVKYTGEGGSVRLSTQELSCENGRAVYQFVCEDTGQGMSESFLAHAFEPFTQEAGDARTVYMGTGLGLAIAKQLTEMMGGSISVESHVNVGTRFTVTLPFEIDREYVEESIREETVDREILKGKRVLLAEDNALNMEIARFFLENAGMEVTVAENGMEAVELFKASPKDSFDLILMDVMMPVMDGLSATRKIRALKRADASTVPIFAMTANAFSEDVESSRLSGMNEHLSKPLEEGKLLAAIAKYLKAGR